MQSFSQWFDNLADINSANRLVKWLERISFFFLILMILSAPHSIAATQISWLTGMFVWVIRLFVKPRLKLTRTPLDIALWALFGWTILSSICSYAPDISIDKLRNATLFLIFYFIINVVKTKRAAVFLTAALIFSCMFNVVWTPLERVIGRGVEISGVKKESPLTKALLFSGDTLLEVNKKKIYAPEDLAKAIEENETVQVRAYRPDYNFDVPVKRADLLKGDTALEKLGVDSWKPSRSWRSAGFYAHYTTYAEVLQLIASLTLGLLISLVSLRLPNNESQDFSQKDNSQPVRRPSKFFQPKVILLAISLAGMILALILTATRASMGMFLVSAFVILLINRNRKLLFGLTAILLPVAITGALLLQQTRQLDIFDSKDGSTQYRLMMYRDGFRLWTTSARNFVLGVGMDSTKRYWREWDLFDKGWQPLGHFHSTPLQLAVERGLPALLLWLWAMWIYVRTLMRFLKSQNKDSASQTAIERGIVLGALGGLVGFFTSGLVHYNYGDAVIAMMFFIIMGLSVKITEN
jgi:hypothetical protein